VARNGHCRRRTPRNRGPESSRTQFDETHLPVAYLFSTRADNDLDHVERACVRGSSRCFAGPIT
jgi:hypothetical protein